MNQSSWQVKFLGTTFVAVLSMAWYLAIADAWETVIFKCQPSPEQVICRISGEPYPGVRRNIEIPKTQLSGVKHTFRSMEGNLVQHIVLTTKDGRTIPLNIHPAGNITIQIIKQQSKISAFIKNPQAKDLMIETQQQFPLRLYVITGGIICCSGFYLKRLWIDNKPGLKFF
jgi:hypothetical protein